MVDEIHEELFKVMGSLPGVSEENYQKALTELAMFREATDMIYQERTHDLDEELDHLDTEYRKERNNQEDKLDELYLRLRKLENEGNKGENR